MGSPSPLAVLSGALKIADKFTIAMEAVGIPRKKASRSPKPAVNSVDHPLLDNAAPGSLAAKRGPGRPSGFTPEMQQRILTLVAETNLSLRQMCKQ